LQSGSSSDSGGSKLLSTSSECELCAILQSIEDFILLLAENHSATASSAEDTVCCDTSLSVTLEPDTRDTRSVQRGVVEGVVSQIADVTAEVNSAVGDVIGKGVDWSSCGTTNNVNALEVHEWLLDSGDGSVGAVTSAVGAVGFIDVGGVAEQPSNWREPSVDLGANWSSNIVVALNVPEDTEALRDFSNAQGSNEASANSGVSGVPLADGVLLRSTSLEVESTGLGSLVVLPGSKGVGSIGLNGSRVSDFVGNGLAAWIGLVNNEWCLLITIVIIIFIEYSTS